MIVTIDINEQADMVKKYYILAEWSMNNLKYIIENNIDCDFDYYLTTYTQDFIKFQLVFNKILYLYLPEEVQASAQIKFDTKQLLIDLPEEEFKKYEKPITC